MNRRILILCMAPLVLVASLNAAMVAADVPSQISVRSSPGCHKLNAQSDHNRETLLVLDRTTALDVHQKATQVGPTTARWNEGINRIVTSGEVIGALRVLEIRETAVGMRDLGGGCLDRFTRDDPAASGSMLQKLSNQSMQAVVDFVKGHDDDDEARLITVAQTERKQLGAKLKQLAQVDDPTKSESEIALALVEEIQSSCSHRRVCDVYIFSDLLDTKAKVGLHKSRDAAISLGRSRAEALLKEYRIGNHSTMLRVTVWGFGRDDARPGSELEDLPRTALRNYWLGFFKTVTSEFGPDSGCVISDSFPSSFTPGGCQ